MASHELPHIQELVCLDGISAYHLLECGHYVECPEDTLCKPNCMNVAERFTSKETQQEAIKINGSISCSECVKTKIFIRDVAPIYVPTLTTMLNSQLFKEANDQTRPLLLDCVSTENLGLTDNWNREVEKELQSRGGVVGRAVSGAEDRLADVLSGMGIASTGADAMDLATQDGSKEVAIRNVLPDNILPMQGTLGVMLGQMDLNLNDNQEENKQDSKQPVVMKEDEFEDCCT